MPNSTFNIQHSTLHVRCILQVTLRILLKHVLFHPLNITELASHLQGTCYVTRQSVETVASIKKAKKAIRKAFEASMQGKGSSLVEIVSTCNSGWKLSPVASNKWLEENMLPFYQLGDIKDLTKK